MVVGFLLLHGALACERFMCKMWTQHFSSSLQARMVLPHLRLHGASWQRFCCTYHSFPLWGIAPHISGNQARSTAKSYHRFFGGVVITGFTVTPC